MVTRSSPKSVSVAIFYFQDGGVGAGKAREPGFMYTNLYIHIYIDTSIYIYISVFIYIYIFYYFLFYFVVFYSNLSYHIISYCIILHNKI